MHEMNGLLCAIFGGLIEAHSVQDREAGNGPRPSGNSLVAVNGMVFIQL
jgi:hypothetical protein